MPKTENIKDLFRKIRPFTDEYKMELLEAELAALEAELEPMVFKYSPGNGKFCVDCINTTRDIGANLDNPVCAECLTISGSRPYWREKPTKPTLREIEARLIEEMPSKNWCISYMADGKNATFGVYNGVALRPYKNSCSYSHAATFAEAKAGLAAKLARSQPEKSAIEKLIDAVGEMPANDLCNLYWDACAEFDAQKEAKK